jgi:hypothetical protein
MPTIYAMIDTERPQFAPHVYKRQRVDWYSTGPCVGV